MHLFARLPSCLQACTHLRPELTRTADPSDLVQEDLLLVLPKFRYDTCFSTLPRGCQKKRPLFSDSRKPTNPYVSYLLSQHQIYAKSLLHKSEWPAIDFPGERNVI